MSFHRPFCRTTSLAVPAVAALVLLTPASTCPRSAQGGPGERQQRRLRYCARPDPRHRRPAPTIAAVDPASPPQQKSLTAKAIDKVKEVAKSAGDIFSRVPCLPPKGGAKTMGSLPHVAGKLAAGEPVVIVAFGSSSTAGLRRDARRNSPIPTGWRRSCAGNIRPPTSPCSIAARAAKTRPK